MVAKRTPPKKAPIVVDETIPIAHIELSENSAIDINLIRSGANRYVSVDRKHLNKTEQSWKYSKGIWLPFEHSKEIGAMITQAYVQGLKMHWDQPVEQNDNYDIQKAIDDAQDALDRLKQAVQNNQSQEYQKEISLFDKLTNSLFHATNK